MSSGLTLASLCDANALAGRLERAGLLPAQAQGRSSVIAQAAGAMAGQGLPPHAAAQLLLVPGRVELLGKHTDYAGGRSLVVATQQGLAAVVCPREDALLRVTSSAQSEPLEFAISPDLDVPQGHWSNYPRTVARRLARNFGALRGADIALASDLPPASGMSSSSALMIALSLALMQVNGLQRRREYSQCIASSEELAGYLGCVENGQSFGPLAGDRGVGTFGGSEDHTAILCCRTRQLSLYRYCPVVLERRVEWPADHMLCVVSSGVDAVKTGSAMAAYNRASLLAREAVSCWNAATGRKDPHLAAAIASAADAPSRLRDVLRRADSARFAPADLLRRAEHFQAESVEIIPAAVDALRRGDLAVFGFQVDRSQELTERLLQNHVPQTVYLAKAARRLGGVAASAFGAGFGGAVWAMVPAADAHAFLQAWLAEYAAAFPDCAARGLITEPSAAACWLT